MAIEVRTGLVLTMETKPRMKNAHQQRNSSRQVEKGIEQYNLGGTSDAYMSFKQASVFNPESARALYYLATVEFELKNYYEAETHVEAALRLNDKKLNGDVAIGAYTVYRIDDHFDFKSERRDTKLKELGI